MEKDRAAAVPDAAVENASRVIRTETVGRDGCDYTKEFVLPDYIPDVRRIISSGARASVVGTGRNGDFAGWECTVVFEALLLCDGGTVRSVSLQGTQGGEMRLEPDTGDFRLEVELENAAVRASDPRRLTGRCRMEVCARGRTTCPTEMRVLGDGADAGSVETLREKVCGVFVGTAVKENVRVSRDIDPPAGCPEITDIVRCTVTPYVTSVRVSGRTAEVRGEAEIGVIYSGPDGKYGMFTERCPLGTEVELPEDGTEVCYACASVGEIKAAAAPNAYGEQKTVELDFSWDLELYSVCPCTFGTVSDAYSTRGELTAKNGTVRYDRLAACFTDRISVRGESTAEDLSLGRSDGICLYFADASVDRAGAGKDGELEFKGTVLVNALFETGAEGDPYAPAEMRIPFTYTRKADLSDGPVDCRSSVSVTACRLRQDGGRITAELELQIGALVTQTCGKTVITEAELTGPLPEKGPAMTLYFVDPGDDLWSVAKRFRVPADEILRRNGMTEDDLKNRRVIAVFGGSRQP